MQSTFATCRSLYLFKLCGELLEMAKKLVYLGSYVVLVVTHETNLSTMKARSAYDVCHLWWSHDASKAVKGRVFNPSMIVILLHTCDLIALSWVCSANVSYHRCVVEFLKSSGNIRLSMFGFVIWLNPVITTQLMLTSWNCRFSDLVMFYECRRNAFHIVHYLLSTDLVKKAARYSVYCIALPNERKLYRIGLSKRPNLGPKDGATQWFVSLSDMAQKRSQWQSCCSSILKLS